MSYPAVIPSASALKCSEKASALKCSRRNFSITKGVWECIKVRVAINGTGADDWVCEADVNNALSTARSLIDSADFDSPPSPLGTDADGIGYPPNATADLVLLGMGASILNTVPTPVPWGGTNRFVTMMYEDWPTTLGYTVAIAGPMAITSLSFNFRGDPDRYAWQVIANMSKVRIHPYPSVYVSKRTWDNAAADGFAVNSSGLVYAGAGGNILVELSDLDDICPRPLIFPIPDTQSGIFQVAKILWAHNLNQLLPIDVA